MASRLLLLAWLLAAPCAQAGVLPDPLPDIATSYYLELDGRPLWAHQPQRKLPAASLNKLMTALLVLEQDQLDSPITVSRAAARERGVGLRAGEQFRTRDLLVAMLIASANDACHALASPADFVRRMNARARQLGLRDTHYANACGQDAAGQYTSAHDLALLAHELLKHPQLTAITLQRGARITTGDGKRSYSFASRNALIGRVPGVLGLKTGYTRRAGRCQAIYAERDGHRVLLVILHGARWGDAADLLALAFDQAGH